MFFVRTLVGLGSRGLLEVHLSDFVADLPSGPALGLVAL
jgi:hypothetical protein